MLLSSKITESMLLLLRPYSDVGAGLGALLERSILRIIDSKMLIENDLSEASFNLKKISLLQTETSISNQQESSLELKLQLIENDGISDHLIKLLDDFGGIFVSQNASYEQQKLIEEWNGKRFTGAFLMSDHGGPSLSSWKSVAHRDQEHFRIYLDKVWIIGVPKIDFGFLIARFEQSLFPALFLISPDAFSLCQQTPTGSPFIGGKMQLGRIRGQITVSADFQFKKATPLALSRYLSTVRPYFSRAVIAHLRWLLKKGMIQLNTCDIDVLENLEKIALKVSKEVYAHELSLVVKILKFSLNEFILDILSKQKVTELENQRDLLAFTKMEGSSYRCFYEFFYSLSRA